MLTLIVGTGISVYVYDSLRQREQGILKNDSIQRYKEMISQLDLLFSNSILRIQSYEEYLGSRPRAYKSDAIFMRQALAYTIFQRFAILENTHQKEKGTGYPEMRLLLRLDSKNSILEPVPVNQKTVRSEIVKQAFQRMIEGNTLQKAVLHNYSEVPRVSFIMRSRTNKDTFFVFTAPLSAVFSKTDLRPGESLDVTDSESGFSWRVEALEDGQKKVRPNPPNASNIFRDGYHHYLYVEGLPQSGMKLNFAFNFKEPKRELSPGVIAGLMSFLMTVVISYLFLVLVRQNELVTKLVIEKTTDLEKAHHEMQEVLLGKSRFLGNISHEIRTPLNLILGMIDLCEEEDKDKKISEYLRSMRASGNHLLSMIEDLLDLAKADSNNLQVHLKKINLLQFLDETARIAGQDILKKDLRFYAQFAADLPVSIQCDPSRLRQILMNLLRNASKYTNQGHISFRVSRMGNLTGSRCTLRFEVEDTGVGIAEDKLGKIFDAFFQVEGSYALAEGGVGLGLAIVKELVRKLGGRLMVKSKAKKGSTFSVDLDVESLESQSWVESYRPVDDLPCELMVITKDASWRHSVAMLAQHNQIRLNFVNPEDARQYVESHPQKEPRWILVDATMAGFSMSLIQHDPKVGRVIVAGPRKKLLDVAADPQVVVIDNSPLLVSDILTSMGFSNRPKKRTEKKELVAKELAPVANVIASPISLIVADDDIGNKELYMAYFEKTPWHIEFAMNGKEAWELYLQKPSDVLVLDLRMPIMDGFEVVEKVREHEAKYQLPSKPILLVTADALDSTAEKALALPKVSFLTKPIKKSVLFDSIQKVLS